ncbi:hypothetical protein [Microbispora sp. NPDC049125]|uniref:hypothetical protein n=1 Tax=Microbispora sp. NPDC049125 TaxID=3154929 RepID=UPI003465DE5D
MKELSPAMKVAILDSAEDGTISASKRTEGALIDRGLAAEVRGDAMRPAYRYTGVKGSTTRVYNAYLGARLNENGLRLRAELRAGQEK